MFKTFGIFMVGLLCILSLIVEAEPDQDFKRFSFRISGIYGNLNIGDFNTILKDTELYYDILLSPHEFMKNRDLRVIDNAWGLKVEFMMGFSKHFSAGIETGYIQQSLNSSVAWENMELGLFSLNAKPQMYFVPVILNGYGYLPLNSRIKVYIVGGPGLYMVQTQYEYEQNSQISGEEGASNTEFNSQGSRLGWQGGIGLEIKLSSSTSFYIEGRGRYVNLNKLTGRMSVRPGFGGASGDIWYFDYFDNNLSQYISGLKYGTKPESDNYKNIRRLGIDLSGFYIGLGLRIHIGNWE